MADKNRDDKWDFYLRTLSNSSRDSNSANDPASDPSILQSVCLILFLQFSVWFPRKMEKNLFADFSFSLALYIFSVFPFFLFFFIFYWSGEEALRIVQSREFGGFGCQGLSADQQALSSSCGVSVSVSNLQRPSLTGLAFVSPKTSLFQSVFLFSNLLLILRFMIVMRCRNRKSINFGSNLDWFG